MDYSQWGLKESDMTEHALALGVFMCLCANVCVRGRSSRLLPISPLALPIWGIISAFLLSLEMPPSPPLAAGTGADRSLWFPEHPASYLTRRRGHINPH